MKKNIQIHANMKLTFDMRRILKGRQDIDKICVATCAKHEKRYIIDFVEYYLNVLHVDMIIIADNNDDKDDENLTDILQNYINKNQVIVLTQFRNKIEKQNHVIKYVFEKYRNEYSWMISVDVDEYLQMNNGMTLQEYLPTLSEFDVISINWQIYTDGNLLTYDDKPVYKRFTKKYVNKNKYYDTNYTRSNYQCKSIINCKINN